MRLRAAACAASLVLAAAPSSGCGSYASPGYLGESLLVLRGIISNPQQAPTAPDVQLSLVWDGALVAGSTVVEPRLPSDFVLTLYAPPADAARGELLVATPAQLDAYVAGEPITGTVGRADRFVVAYGDASSAVARNGFELRAQRACDAQVGPCDAPYEAVPLETPVTVVLREEGP